MSATNKTDFLGLPVFVPTDKPSWQGDFNCSMRKIDTGVSTNATGVIEAKEAAAVADAKAVAAQSTADKAVSDAAIADQKAVAAQTEATLAHTTADSAITRLNGVNEQIQRIDNETGQIQTDLADVATQVQNNVADITTLAKVFAPFKFTGSWNVNDPQAQLSLVYQSGILNLFVHSQVQAAITSGQPITLRFSPGDGNLKFTPAKIDYQSRIYMVLPDNSNMAGTMNYDSQTGELAIQWHVPTGVTINAGNQIHCRATFTTELRG